VSVTKEEYAGLLARKGRQAQQPGKARKAATPKEREIQRAILEFLKTVPGVVAWKTGGGMFRLTHKGKERMVRMGHRGVSDIVGFRSQLLGSWGQGFENNARFLAIEVKTAKTFPTAEQQAFLDQVKAAGGIAVCARSVHDVALALGMGERGSPPSGPDEV
jgi:hypothetical protein